MWLIGGKKRKKTRVLFILKHPDDLFIVRSNFFLRCRLWRRDYDSPRSKDNTLALEVVRGLVKPVGVSAKIGDSRHVFSDVKIEGQKHLVDIRLVVIHLTKQHTVELKPDLCVSLSERPDIDSLVRRRVEKTLLRQVA